MRTRRAFFTGGGAAAVATVAGGAVAGNGQIAERNLLDARDRESIRAALAAWFANRECWQDLSRHRDVVTLHDRQRATAVIHFEEVECTPLEGDCTAAQMARLQGNVADRSWVARRLEVDLVNEGEWRISRVRLSADGTPG
jgi:hypothetical protein